MLSSDAQRLQWSADHPPAASFHTYFAGKNRRTSTKEESIGKAKEIAEDWYLRLRGKLQDGEIKNEKTFREVSKHYLVKRTNAARFGLDLTTQLNQPLRPITAIGL